MYVSAEHSQTYNHDLTYTVYMENVFTLNRKVFQTQYSVKSTSLNVNQHLRHRVKPTYSVRSSNQNSNKVFPTSRLWSVWLQGQPAASFPSWRLVHERMESSVARSRASLSYASSTSSPLHHSLVSDVWSPQEEKLTELYSLCLSRKRWFYTFARVLVPSAVDRKSTRLNSSHL